VRRRFVAQGLDGAVRRKPSDRVYARRIDGEAGVHLMALSCSEPPAGRDHWSMRLLATKLVELGSSQPSPGRRFDVRSRNALKPWLKRQWCIPPKQNGEFVWRMEDVLAVYTRPSDRRFPLVCLDEVSKQLLADTRPPAGPAPGRPRRADYEYQRHGTANLFLWCEPLRGRRHVRVTERRPRVDWAHAIRDLLGVRYPEAERIVLVQDNLKTHTPGSLYEAFPPEQAKRLVDWLELHYTPKHGSWLNIAEIELSVLARPCLDRRLPNRETLASEVAAWEADRNAAGGAVNWQFRTEDARVKLKHLYPAL
jgi:hypothetical protein